MEEGDVCLPSPQAVTVLDFDRCLLKIHSYGMRMTPEDVEEADDLVFQGYWAIPPSRLKEFLKEKRVYIASFGLSEVIHAFLIRAGLDKMVLGVLTPKLVGGVDGCSLPSGKNALLEMVEAAEGLTDRSFLTLYDDDPNNIRLALEVGFGAVHADPLAEALLIDPVV